jgi:CRP-like cAMP-binding protein
MLGIRQTFPYRPYTVPDGLGDRLGLGTCGYGPSPEMRRGSLSDGARQPVSVRNRILAGLSRKESARILPHLVRVTLKSGQVLYEPGANMSLAYFLETAVVSILSLAEDGTSLEVSVVGDEGMIGVPIVLGSGGLPYKIIVQGSGTAWRMRADVLRKEFYLCGPLHKLILHYLHTELVFLSQASACNRFHTVQQRLGRWLLTAQDRTGSNEIESTQEFLSQMLGVNRSSANQAAGALQREGLIRYRRGRITVLDGSGLEAAACECYRIVKGEVDRFFPA